MMKFVRTAITDADIILYVTDVIETWDKNIQFIEKLNKVAAPVIVAINKTDLAKPEAIDLLITEWNTHVPKATVMPISARMRFNVPNLFNIILEKLPEGPAYYPVDSLTDKPAGSR